MVLDDQVDMWLALSHIKDYFYVCEVPQPLSEFFALPDVPGWHIRALGGRENDLGDIEDHEMIAPVFKVLPMGVKWSFYLGQLAHAHQLKESFDWVFGAILSDRRPLPRMQAGVKVAMPYCGNLAVGASTRAEADSAREVLMQRLAPAGFGIHEAEEAQRYAESLGFAVNGMTLGLGPGAKKGWKTRLASDWLLARPKITGGSLSGTWGT